MNTSSTPQSDKPVPFKDYLKHLDAIADEDVKGLRIADAAAGYGGSWKKRGGVGSFMMLARKFDRIDNALVNGYDEGGDPIYRSIFTAIMQDVRAEGVIDDIRDLRRYCLLVEAEARARGYASAKTTHRDNQLPPRSEQRIMITITVNGSELVYPAGQELSFNELIGLAGFPPERSPSVVVKRKDRSHATLSRGDGSVQLEDGMRFDIADTSRA